MRKKYLYIIFMVIFAIFIGLNFGIHIYRTDKFNEATHVLADGINTEDCSFTFAPQNGTEVSWTRTATLDGETIDLNACSFSGKFINTSTIAVSDWALRLEITGDCYLNSAWNGLVEIHQFDGSVENIQLLNLKEIETSEVTLTFYEDGDIFLFPLHEGDYLIYYPNADANELPITAKNGKDGETSIGIIIYWAQGSSLPYPDYSVGYQNHKSYFQGKEVIIFFVTCTIWILTLVAGIAASIAQKVTRAKAAEVVAKKEIERQTTEKMLDAMIKALASTIDAKDAYTHGHSERVAKYALMLAQSMKLSNEECKQIFYAGLVHDVGKIAIPESIINKPGKLTDEEFAVIKSHPTRGENILLQIEDMPYLAVGAKYHHERYDGFGYPSRAKGEEIPLLARIIAVADSYDAMTSQRSYRKTLDQQIVKQEIWKGIGTQFDPIAAKHMIALIDADVNYDMREKQDEKYEMINAIRTNEFWQNYSPKSISSTEMIMSATDMKYFSEFINSVDYWMNPVKLSDITGEERTFRFNSKTWDNAEFIWSVPATILYSSDDGNPMGENYRELAVFMCAGYSWKTGVTLSETNVMRKKEAFGDWNNWLAKNKEGMEYHFTARREKNVIHLLLENELISIEGKVELPADYDKPVYFSVSGENCAILDVEEMRS